MCQSLYTALPVKLSVNLNVSGAAVSFYRSFPRQSSSAWVPAPRSFTPKRDGYLNYLGGTGVGGGTLTGLSKKMLGIERIDHIVELAKDGSLDNVDLRIKDISKKKSAISLPENMTASNFGKLSDIASAGDIALAIINMVFETAGMLGIFAARDKGLHDIVLTGNLTTIPQAKDIFESLNAIFDINFIIPENAQFATAIGAALA